MTRGRRDLAALVGPVLLKPHASGGCVIAEGRFNTRALLASTRIFGSLVAGDEPQPHSDTSLLAGALRGRRPGDVLPGNEAELVAGRALNELRDFKLEP